MKSDLCFNIKTPISCLSFDDTHRRLIIGCRDGTARIYNHNNGSLLKNLKARKQGKEVAALHMVTIGQSEYFLSVGWDRHINLYPEIDKKHVIDVRPLGLWDDDVRKGHKEDIISAALIGLNLLATASFDGEILIWNMVSGKVLNRIKREQIYMSMDPELESSDDVENGPFFTCLAKYQEKKKILVAGHQNGSILFYNLLGPSPTLIAVTQVANYPISHLSLTEDGELLFCGDTNGNIYILDLFDFSFELSHTQVAPISATWRGHVDCVTLTASVDNREILLTSSLDATCRAWTFDGEYVGTFGQKEKWDLMEETSWVHPYTPDDVLMETTFPTLKKMEGGDAPSSAGSSKPWRNRVKYDLSNEDMFEEIRATLNSSTGKRLSLQRRLSQQPVDTKKDPASNAWRSLKIHDIGEEDVEELEKPTSMTEDPFALKSEESKHSNHVRFS
ncbi:unnamed protein product [Oikopleura dioica]|uniref:Uncharacterized protein n=1 Tax=Oikopleura dioica TaxID=34765 RepID=E4X8V2_OIKDI|nr:unnamed protein product [Oikopleura dioica]